MVQALMRLGNTFGLNVAEGITPSPAWPGRRFRNHTSIELYNAFEPTSRFFRLDCAHKSRRDTEEVRTSVLQARGRVELSQVGVEPEIYFMGGRGVDPFLHGG